MPRSAVIAVAVLGVLALAASTVFGLVRSAQLRTAEQRIAALSAELDRLRQGGGATGDAPSGQAPSRDDPQGDLFGDGLEDLFGSGDADLARCLQPDAPLGSRSVGDGDAGTQLKQISALVEELRGLDFEREPDTGFLDGDQVAERISAQLEEDHDAEEAALDVRVLSALAAVPADVDLLELQRDLLTTQVAGFYDPDTGELVVRAEGTDEGLAPVARVTLAHELAHAVVDQTLGLPVDATEDTAESDAALAALSVIEGDATLVQQHFALVGLSLSDQLALSMDPMVLESQRQLEGVPHLLAQSLQFPYVAGLRFVCARYADGGWDAVDALYDDLPTTSAEILDPARYGTPSVDPRDPGEPGGEWRRARATTLGAADLLWLFEAPGDDRDQALDDPRGRALEWTGGELVVWTRGDDAALGIALTQREPGGPLCDAVTTWYRRTFPDSSDAPTRSDERLVREGPQTAVVICVDDEVRMGVAPDLQTARALVQ